jgi:undecaprenyl-diphosphatase
MTLLQALVLGIVQGATEFLPISSSGHLVLVPWLLGWRFEPGVAFVFDVLVQWGTLAAVLVYFRDDLIRLVKAAVGQLAQGRPLGSADARLAWALAAASLPAALLGLLLKDLVETAFGDPLAVSLFLLVTALLLGLSERIGRRRRTMHEVGLLDALLIGLAQAAALFPGISRSGATIAGGLMRDLRRAEAARFSFLMSVPVMIGAGAIALLDLGGMASAAEQLPALIAGFLSAALVGYVAIRWLLAYLASHRLTVFVIYCALLGLTGVGISLLRS